MEKQLPPEIERELKELVFRPYNPYLALDAWLQPYIDLMLRYGGEQVAAATQAASASACPECAGGDEPEYDERWMAWYHGRDLCLGTGIRHAIRVAMP